jgi:hypothetical protein
MKELMQLNRLYPRCKFADKNTLQEQLVHIRSELREVNQAMRKLRMARNPKPHLVDRLLEELHDLSHSTQTMMDIVVRDYPGADPQAIWLAVIEKNKARGYYND